MGENSQLLLLPLVRSQMAFAFGDGLEPKYSYIVHTTYIPSAPLLPSTSYVPTAPSRMRPR